MDKRDWEEELRADAHEAKCELMEEAKHEHMMFSDVDYAIAKYEDVLLDIYEQLSDVSKELSKYGHNESPRELLDYV